MGPMEVDQVDFYEALRTVRIPEDGLRLQNRDEGTDNVALNFNCNGVTWAFAIRYPPDHDGHRFVAQKIRTIAVTRYLASIFGRGVPLAGNDRFVFDGLSILTEPNSTKQFLHTQSERPPLIYRDDIRKIGPTEYLLSLPVSSAELEYDGPFFASKGAPATETLKDSVDFAEVMIRGLAALHVGTGASELLDGHSTGVAFEEMEGLLASEAAVWEPLPGSKDARRIGEYAALAKARRRSKLQAYVGAKREVFLQRKGRELLRNMVQESFGHELSKPQYRSFVHGDAHGRNFIVVFFGFEVAGAPDSYVDRIYLNGLFQQFPELDKITVEVSDHEHVVVYREYEPGDENGAECIIAERSQHFDVHLIDPDTGRGVNANEKECYVLDLATLCMSVRNWSAIHRRPLLAIGDIIRIYEDEFRHQRAMSAIS